ncbi:uncharacterized protein LOC107615860 [Arachis ipaensis]|uniref:uncharacterized protein LOC107615860 n=1 Tax=Arachis ipaensis TaxID=130454 RepID=UPI0007AF61D3|nr:uncharacterized protein LOC107615860 [Arachis ipaensis]
MVITWYKTRISNPYIPETLSRNLKVETPHVSRCCSWPVQRSPIFLRSPTIFSGDISSGVDLLQRRSPPVTSPPASSPYQPLCLLHQNRQHLPFLPLRRSKLFARIHREWRNRFRHLRSKINSNLCSAALPPLTFLYFSAWCLCCCPSLFQRVSKNRMKDSVNYQIISPKDLAKSVLSSIIEFTREDVEALLNEKAKRKDRFSYKIKGVIKVGEATGRRLFLS